MTGAGDGLDLLGHDLDRVVDGVQQYGHDMKDMVMNPSWLGRVR